MQRMHSCDSTIHVSAIIGFGLVIQFSCFVQAFRGRHLPSIMNDGMSLVYASFATIVMVTVMYIIVPFQNRADKELYQNLTIAINTFIIKFMLYGQKAIRMLIFPQQNTKKYFQDQRLREMKDIVDTKMGVINTE